jgi:NFACT protein RNA binding domain
MRIIACAFMLCHVHALQVCIHQKHRKRTGAYHHHKADSCRFHVDNLSSAHVYLRLPDGGTLDDIPANVLEECCQIVKHNSIQGCKSSSVDIVYTLWSNLKKAPSMEVRFSRALHHCDGLARVLPTKKRCWSNARRFHHMLIHTTYNCMLPCWTLWESCRWGRWDSISRERCAR